MEEHIYPNNHVYINYEKSQREMKCKIKKKEKEKSGSFFFKFTLVKIFLKINHWQASYKYQNK